MKEVLTKRFWQDVKKTFDEARDDSPPKDSELPAPAESQPTTSSPLQPPRSQEDSSKPG